jgi:hypothetical protein
MLRRDMLRRAALAAPAILAGGTAARAMEPVDVELVLAVDASRSVDAVEQDMQLRGYANAFRDERVVDGIAGGPLGAIAVMLFVWSGFDVQHTLVPWTRLDGRRTAEGFAARIEAAPRRSYLYTSISGAIDYAARQFGRGYEGTRRVVDISGDGVSNSGRPLADARADALEMGIVLNGLAVLDRTPQPAALTAGLPPLDAYYRDEVIGGPGSFLVVAEGFDAFEAAVRRKIVREIAASPPPGPLVEYV